MSDWPPTEPPTEGERRAHLIGAFQTCDRLLTSPRFNKPQREIIERFAYDIMDQLKAMGVEFKERTPEEHFEHTFGKEKVT